MYRLRDGEITRRTENACIVADVAAQQHKSAGPARGSDKATKVANCMSWAVEKIKATISKVVKSWEAADVKNVRSFERDFAQITYPVQRLAKGCRAVKIILSIIYTKSLSRSGESGFAGAPGNIAFLNPGPTIKSVLGGKVAGLPIWSQCQ